MNQINCKIKGITKLQRNHTFSSVIIDSRFPASQFGTLYGLGIFVGGTFGIFQYVLFKVTSGPLKGDPFWVSTKAEG